jgi:hypothetical protein
MTAPKAPISERTGEPRRHPLVWLILCCSFAAVGFIACSLFTVYWVCVYDFNSASWLGALIPTEYGSGWRILLAVALTVIALLPAISAAISGYYLFSGYRWARVAAIISFGLSGLGVLLNGLAWPAMALTLLAAALGWLPPVKAYCAAWDALRHAEPVYSEPVNTVAYGPLPRYL